jgi:hypothetical protein
MQKIKDTLVDYSIFGAVENVETKECYFEGFEWRKFDLMHDFQYGRKQSFINLYVGCDLFDLKLSKIVVVYSQIL